MASGETLLIFTAVHGEPPSSNFATFDLRNLHPVLDFDPTTNESMVFGGVLPRNYGGGGITAYIHYSMSTAESGDVDWDIAFERIGDQQQDVDSDSFATAKSVDDTTVPSTSGFVDIVSIAFSNGSEIDSIAVGEKFRLKITRDAASDTASGDAELHAIELKET
jgi:hypothetical protein